MATTLIPAPAPEIVETTVVTTSTEVHPLTPRQEVIQKYQNLYEQPPKAPEPAPQPAPQPVEDRLTALEQENAELKQKLNTQPPPSAEPVVTPPSVPATPSVASNEPPLFVKHLVEGNWNGFVEELVKTMEPQLAKEFMPQAVKQSSEAIHAEAEINNFVMDMRKSNPELAEFEPWIATAVNTVLQNEVNAGKIKGPMDFSERYKSLLTSEVEKAKRVVQTLHAAGKAEGAGAKKEVLSTTVLPPSSMERREGAAPKEAFPTLEDYFAKRRAAQAKSRGLTG